MLTMVKIKRAPVSSLHMLDGEIIRKNLRISGMSFKNVPVIAEVHDEGTSYHVSQPVYKRIYTMLRTRKAQVVSFDDFA